VRVYSLPQDAPGGNSSGNFGASGHWFAGPRTAGYLDLSRKLAELIQIQMAQRFRGSPEIPTAAPVRQLRTIAAPP